MRLDLQFCGDIQTYTFVCAQIGITQWVKRFVVCEAD